MTTLLSADWDYFFPAPTWLDEKWERFVQSCLMQPPSISGDIAMVRPWEVEPLLQQLKMQKQVLEMHEQSEK